MSANNYGPASRDEQIVFGASRPGYPSTNVDERTVDEWLDFMAGHGIKRVICLLPDAQLGYYSAIAEGLVATYRHFFGSHNVLHVKVEDYRLTTAEVVRNIMSFLSTGAKDDVPVVVHCSGGSGRTGHVLAAWLACKRGFTPEGALDAVRAMGRNPLEAVQCGNATKDDLIALLESASNPVTESICPSS